MKVAIIANKGSHNRLFIYKYAKPKETTPSTIFYFYIPVDVFHYENTPIQIYTKFHLQKLKIFR